MKPHGMGDLYAAQTVCVGFLSFPGEGAASWGGCYENNLATEDTENTEKKNLCNLRNLWFLLFHCLQGFLSVIKK